MKINLKSVLLNIRLQVSLVILILFTGCNYRFNENETELAARVYNSQLFMDEVLNSFPNNYESIDSSEWIDNYIDNWIKKQLMLRKAELSLNNNEKDVIKQLENYRASLLIHRYEEKLIEEQLDTIVSQEDIESYYEEFAADFRLNTEYVRTVFVKIPKSSPDFIKVQRWYRSNDEEDLNDLEDYSFQNGLLFNFDEKWEKFNTVLERANYVVKNNQDFLQRNTRIENRDSVYRYFVNIKEYRLISDIAPLQVVRNDISKIILNRRRIKLISDAENAVLQEVTDMSVVEKFKP